MPSDNCNHNLPDVFKDCDERVFAFAPDKLPCQNDTINSIPFDDIEDAINVLVAPYRSNQVASGVRLVLRHLSRLRYFMVNSVKYTWPYEARWESNETLQDHFRWNAGKLKLALRQAKKYGLLHNPAKQGQTNRLLRLHDDVLKIAKMSKSERDTYLQSQIAHSRSTTISNEVSKNAHGRSTTILHGRSTTILHGRSTTILHGRSTAIELSNKENEKLTISKRTSDPSNRLVEASDKDQNAMTTNLTRHKPASYEEMILSKEIATTDAVPKTHDHSSSASYRCPDVLDTRLKKRQVLNAWRDVFYERVKDDTKANRVFSYIGDRFFIGLYNNLSNWLGEQGIHNGKVNMIEQMALVVFDQVIFTPGLYKDEFANRCKIKKGHTFLDHQFFEQIRQKAFKSLDERQEPTLEPATAQAVSLDQITAKRVSEMELAGDSDKFIADLNHKFFGHWKIKQLSAQKRDGVLIDIMTNDRSWQLIRDAWNREELDVVFSDTMFNVLLKYSDTFNCEKKNVVSLKKPMSEADRFATSLISQCVQIDRNKPKQIWVR